jgi:hypothetical protein
MTNPKVRNAAVIQSMRVGTFGGFKTIPGAVRKAEAALTAHRGSQPRLRAGAGLANDSSM